MSDKRICVGAIAGAFGVKGEVRLKSFTADPERHGCRSGTVIAVDGALYQRGSGRLGQMLGQMLRAAPEAG